MNQIRKGTHIAAEHINSKTLKFYKVVVERLDKDYYRLVNLKSDMIMSGFKTTNPNEIIGYIEGLGNGQEIVKISD